MKDKEIQKTELYKRLKDKIIEVLKGGGVTSLTQLVNRVGINEREVRRVIAKLPEVGVRVSGGYFLIDTDEGMQETINNLYSRAMSLIRRARKIKDTYYYNKSEKLFKVEK